MWDDKCKGHRVPLVSGFLKSPNPCAVRESVHESHACSQTGHPRRAPAAKRHCSGGGRWYMHNNPWLPQRLNIRHLFTCSLVHLFTVALVNLTLYTLFIIMWSFISHSFTFWLQATIIEAFCTRVLQWFIVPVQNKHSKHSKHDFASWFTES